MSKTRDASKYLKNPNIKKVTGSNIQFREDFKIKAMTNFQKGISADEIFEKAGIDLSDFDKGYARKSITRWLEASEKYGANGLGEERRGMGAPGRPRGAFKTIEEEVEYLRAEVEFLKELRALGISKDKKKSIK